MRTEHRQRTVTRTEKELWLRSSYVKEHGQAAPTPDQQHRGCTSVCEHL